MAIMAGTTFSRAKQFVIGILVLALGGCASSPEAYRHETFTTGYIKQVAVLPLENHTQEKYVDQRVRDLLMTEIMTLGYFQVLEKGQLKRFLDNEIPSKDKTQISHRIAKRLGREFGVQAYFAGAVDDYTTERNGSYSYPVVSVSLRLVDIKSGKILWQATDNASGYSSWDRLLGFESENIHQVCQRLLRRMLATLNQ